MIEKAWDWNKINNNYWEIPDEYMFYLVDRWKRNRETQILDLGCGIGRHAMLFAKNNFSVTAADISQSGLNKLDSIAKENNLSIKTILSNITKLPVDDKKFDNILAFNSIYHTNTKGFKEAISEMKRVLKKEGEVFITLLSKEDPSFELASDKIVDENTRMKEEEDGTELPHFFVGYEDIYKLFNGFKIISIKQITEYFNAKRHIHFNVLMKLEENNENRNE